MKTNRLPKNRRRHEDYGIDRFMGKHLRGKAQAIIIPLSAEKKQNIELKKRVRDLEARLAAIESRLGE